MIMWTLVICLLDELALELELDLLPLAAAKRTPADEFWSRTDEQRIGWLHASAYILDEPWKAYGEIQFRSRLHRCDDALTILACKYPNTWGSIAWPLPHQVRRTGLSAALVDFRNTLEDKTQSLHFDTFPARNIKTLKIMLCLVSGLKTNFWTSQPYLKQKFWGFKKIVWQI